MPARPETFLDGLRTYFHDDPLAADVRKIEQQYRLGHLGDVRQPIAAVILEAPAGARSVVAESLMLKHQLLILNRSRKRAPNLAAADRLLLGLGALLVSPRRLLNVAVAVRLATLLRFHRALVRRKYRLLFSGGPRRRPGPKGPSEELITVILELKRRNPRFGCPRIAQQLSNAR